MQRSLIAAAMVLALSSVAEARTVTCDKQGCSDWHTPQAVTEPVRQGVRAARKAKRYAVREVSRAGLRLSGVVAPLAAKASEIQAVCGSRVISGVRHTYIAGTRRISLHASGRAVDMQGNPSCIYRLLQGWPGGVSTDYARVNHVHISYAPGGPEWGLRFRHGGGKHRHRKGRRR